MRSLFDQVSVASSQQAQGIDQVTLAISQMEKVTQSTASTAEESAAASQQPSAQAETTLTIVGRLAALAQGDAAAATPASRVAPPRPANKRRRPRSTPACSRKPVRSARFEAPLNGAQARRVQNR